MKSTLLSVLLTLSATFSYSQQNLYFPPLVGSNWDTLSPESLGWCTENIPALYDYLAAENSKAFIVLKDGKIVLEQYFDSFTRDSLWYWASAGKTLTAFLTGIAQEEGYLSLQDPTSMYLGDGWTSCPADKEDLITVRHQLTMSSGLDDGVVDPFCTLPSCLQYLADAGTRWAYHNGPYTLLDDVIADATGQNFSLYFNSRLRNKIGMNGFWFPQGFNNVYFSNARSMARFGLLTLNHGVWAADTILHDQQYFTDMVNTSQTLNKSYGYLWWLNGKESYMIPGLQFVFNGKLLPNAPNDNIAAMGKNGQFVNVAPSQNLVMIRMGNAPDNSLISYLLNNGIWQRLNEVICTATATNSISEADTGFRLYPNPATETFHLQLDDEQTPFSVQLFSLTGQLIWQAQNTPTLDATPLTPGVYVVRLQQGERVYVQRLAKGRL
ncbi:MAG: serine hydrolase [Saprospiraceae bacterium]|nr:serine hydrolase [Saprospiraceae bacterium]